MSVWRFGRWANRNPSGRRSRISPTISIFPVNLVFSSAGSINLTTGIPFIMSFRIATAYWYLMVYIIPQQNRRLHAASTPGVQGAQRSGKRHRELWRTLIAASLAQHPNWPSNPPTRSPDARHAHAPSSTRCDVAVRPRPVAPTSPGSSPASRTTSANRAASPYQSDPHPSLPNAPAGITHFSPFPRSTGRVYSSSNA